VKIYYTDIFPIPLPAEHRFPLEKYTRLRKRVTAAGIVSAEDFRIPRSVTPEELLLVHDPVYIQRLLTGTLTAKEMRRIGFPWSPALVERTLRSAGATLEGSFAALDDSVAVCLSGGTHHAFRDHGEGYCLINDCAIAAKAVIATRRIKRVLVVDCDVHQGNGTAAIFANDPSVYTFSIHGRNNFPFRKETGDIDIAMEDGTGDSDYLNALEDGLKSALAAADAGLAIYLAGADPYHDDRFGRLSLTQKALSKRDHIVFNNCLAAGLPVVTTMAGGYARRIEDTVDIHLQTVAAAAFYQAKDRIRP